MERRELLVRGIHGGVLISLPALPWYQQRDLLISRIQSQERFFKGGRIALDVGDTAWTAEQLQKLLKDLSDEGVCLWTVLSQSPQTREAAEFYGFQTSLPDPKGAGNRSEGRADGTADPLRCLARSLEAGEHYCEDSSLLVLGDVPKDASLEVSGSLIVWGKLSGNVRVGSVGQPATLKFLRCDDPKICLNGLEVEIPAKRKNHLIFELSTENGELHLKSEKTGRLRLL